MERFAYLLETYPVLKIALIVAVVFFIISLIGKLFRLAIGIAVVAFMISVGSTILLGDGTEYVSTATQFLPESYQEQINDAYQDYRQKEAEHPLLGDGENVSDSVLDRIRRAKEAGEELAKGPILPNGERKTSSGD